ncbi:MAG: hypothetical protein WA584_20180 [Pyrinomonadaceae bacterium]
MFSTEGNVPVAANYSNTEANTTKIVKFDETERFEQSYPLNANGRVAVSNVNGSITIETWDRNEVKLVAVKTADDKERLSEVEIQINSTPGSFSVETDYGNWKRDGRGWKNNGRLQVEYTLTVPRGAVLNEIETVNGSVKISNATNTVRASAVNGEVRASNLRGTANLSTVNGTVFADFDQLQTGSKISLDTVNGTVNLTIPSDANATLRADSVNGSITNDFGLPVRKGQYVGRDLYGKVGSGDVQIRLNSVNGGLSIKRKNDGKSVNPAVNLLPQKSEDDEDWDDDNDNDNDNDNDKESLKEMAKAQKDAAKEMRQAQKEIQKIKPEIAKATVDAVKEATSTIATTVTTDIATSVSTVMTEDVQAQIRSAQDKQKAALAKLATINWVAGSPYIEKKSDTFAVKGTPKVTVDANNCDVLVRGWDRNEVKYSVTKVSKERNQTPIQSTIDHTDSAVNIKVANNSDTQNAGYYNPALTRVLVEVYVPKKSNLRIVTNREIRLEGVSGELDLTGSEGAVNVRDSDGKLRVSNDCGKVRVIGFKGEVDVKTTDGTVSLEGDFTKISGKSNNGSFILTLPENANADILANVEELSIENLPDPKHLAEGAWRFGKGGAKYNFTVSDGQVFVRNANALKAS